MRSYLMLGAVLVCFGAAEAGAQSAVSLPPDQIVAIRKAMMDLQQGVAGAMKAAVDSKAEIGPLKAGAQGLVSSTKVIPAMFPAGTEKAGDTKATSDVWSDNATFVKDAQNATAAAEKLEASIESGDKAAFATDFAAMGRTCGACHREFKAKD